MLNKKLLTLMFSLTLMTGAAFADEAVFSQNAVEEIKPEPVTVQAPAAQAEELKPPVAEEVKKEAPAVQTQSVEKAGEQKLSDESFKEAANSLQSAQVDIREQLAQSKALVDKKQAEVDAKKAELAQLKKEYKAILKKMKVAEKTSKMLNDQIQPVSVQQK